MSTKEDRRKWPALGVSILAAYSAAAIGGLFMPGEWYAQLAKPSWTPPDWVFGPVWTLLYTMMAVAAWLVWRKRGFANAERAMTLYGAQLVLNAAWSWIFFGRQQIGVAAIEIVALWVVIVATIVAFWRIRPIAGALLLPYLAWVTLATALNFAIWRLNN